ncbi:MAG: hypothetical protein J3R72DRAFT_431134 [Linnemannia gamsii]|nr:MAG: hypothetical protein J3R72DRAFT_431134 [Linnemannia gamsii]
MHYATFTTPLSPFFLFPSHYPFFQFDPKCPHVLPIHCQPTFSLSRFAFLSLPFSPSRCDTSQQHHKKIIQSNVSSLSYPNPTTNNDSHPLSSASDVSKYMGRPLGVKCCFVYFFHNPFLLFSTFSFLFFFFFSPPHLQRTYRGIGHAKKKQTNLGKLFLLSFSFLPSFHPASSMLFNAAMPCDAMRCHATALARLIVILFFLLPSPLSQCAYSPNQHFCYFTTALRVRAATRVLSYFFLLLFCPTRLSFPLSGVLRAGKK